jgi:hypothetical protein
MLVRLFCFESVGVGYMFDSLIPEVRTATELKRAALNCLIYLLQLVGYLWFAWGLRNARQEAQFRWKGFSHIS